MRTNRIALISAIIVALASQNASFAAPPQRGGPGGGPGNGSPGGLRKHKGCSRGKTDQFPPRFLFPHIPSTSF